MEDRREGARGRGGERSPLWGLCRRSSKQYKCFQRGPGDKTSFITCSRAAHAQMGSNRRPLAQKRITVCQEREMEGLLFGLIVKMCE